MNPDVSWLRENVQGTSYCTIEETIIMEVKLVYDTSAKSWKTSECKIGSFSTFAVLECGLCANMVMISIPFGHEYCLITVEGIPALKAKHFRKHRTRFLRL